MTYRIGESRLWVPTCAAFAAVGLLACSQPQYPNCGNDDDCHSAEFCVDGQCQQCRPGGNDCPAGQQCMDGRCEGIPGYCDSSADCPEGQECVDHQCVANTSGDLADNNGQCSLQSVYFGYDSHELDEATRAAIEATAQCIQQRDVPHVTLTGHCDPRGTEEYNLALGERRAQSVQGHLGRLGVDRGRMTSRSMGEEMARGSDETSWGQDRRVEVEER